MNVEARRIKPAPIRRTLRVKATRQKAFDTFVAMGGWWLKSHSLVAAGQKDVIIEPHAGGRWYEIGNDGAEQSWGKVVAYEAPERLHLIWSLNGEWTYDPDFETNVEVTFAEDGDHTIVTFEHRDLDRYGEQAEKIRGDYESGMDGGWRELLDGYQKAAEAG
ncbi:MAG TPA: SRPBCC family protein [Allosphingosinicella sp.]|nr:SRPBCC family protein [Allosphingosinicella sp.]